MVMMAAYFFSEFKTPELVTPVDAPDDPGIPENRQIAVGGAEREIRDGIEQFADCGRATNHRERVDHHSSLARIALLLTGEAERNVAVGSFVRDR